MCVWGGGGVGAWGKRCGGEYFFLTLRQFLVLPSCSLVLLPSSSVRSLFVLSSRICFPTKPLPSPQHTVHSAQCTQRTQCHTPLGYQITRIDMTKIQQLNAVVGDTPFIQLHGRTPTPTDSSTTRIK